MQFHPSLPGTYAAAHGVRHALRAAPTYHLAHTSPPPPIPLPLPAGIAIPCHVVWRLALCVRFACVVPTRTRPHYCLRRVLPFADLSRTFGCARIPYLRYAHSATAFACFATCCCYAPTLTAPHAPRAAPRFYRPAFTALHGATPRAVTPVGGGHSLCAAVRSAALTATRHLPANVYLPTVTYLRACHRPYRQLPLLSGACPLAYHPAYLPTPTPPACLFACCNTVARALLHRYAQHRLCYAHSVDATRPTRAPACHPTCRLHSSTYNCL